MSARSDDHEGTLHLVGSQRVKAGALTGRRVAGVAAAAVAAAALAACGTDGADQKVIDRLAKLNVMTVPAGSTELSRTSSMGGGNIVIRNASSVSLVYATPETPAEVKRSFHARFDSAWHFHDNSAAPLGGWAASGGPGPGPDASPDTTATVEVHRVATADKAPLGTRSVVTVSVSATRPA